MTTDGVGETAMLAIHRRERHSYRSRAASVHGVRNKGCGARCASC